MNFRALEAKYQFSYCLQEQTGKHTTTKRVFKTEYLIKTITQNLAK